MGTASNWYYEIRISRNGRRTSIENIAGEKNNASERLVTRILFTGPNGFRRGNLRYLGIGYKVPRVYGKTNNTPIATRTEPTGKFALRMVRLLRFTLV